MAIESFPVELLKLITIGLTDKDLCNFILVCRIFHDAVNGDQVAWRSRFLQIYDEPVRSRKNTYDWRTTYQKRQRLLKGKQRSIEFRSGETEEELDALGVLRDILLDAYGYSTTESDPVHGRNFTHIRFSPITRSLFHSHLYEDPHPLLSAISLLLTPVLNLPEQKQLVRLQQIVYRPDRDRVFNADGTPNMRTLNVLARFFTWHLHPKSESDLFHQRTLLEPSEMPGFWEGRLDGGEVEIPVKWFGAYTYLGYHRIINFDLEEVFTDRSDSHLVDMTLSITPSPGAETTFTAIGRDFGEFTVQSGEITPIPPPPELSTITGWKKIQFVKNYENHGWFYEGVMLPGNNMIFGHWRRGKDFVFTRGQSGPFCFWRAPESSSLRFRDNRVSRNMVGAV